MLSLREYWRRVTTLNPSACWSCISCNLSDSFSGLQVLAVVLHKGVTSGVIAETVGWILVHVLSHNSTWAYRKPAQQHMMLELCVRVLRRGLQVSWLSKTLWSSASTQAAAKALDASIILRAD